MTQAFDLLVADMGFIALEPTDCRRIRRGGVVIWAKTRPGGWALLSVQDCSMVGVSAGAPPPGADALLLSPPITDGRRRREVRRTVEAAVFASRAGCRLS